MFKRLLFLCLVPLILATPALAQDKFKVAWSVYVGWMPWDYAGSSGVLKKWADKYGIEIELVRMDYIPSVEAYVANQVDACVMTNMECLNMPAASGIDSTVLIVGDYSNGNDAILTRDNIDIAGLKGQEISLVELSVSHYLLSRCLTINGMKERDVNLVNTSDSDIAPIFITNESQKAVVTWNPMVMEIAQAPGVNNIFNSSDIPGEILDLMVVNSKSLEKNPNLGKALVGAWYEILSQFSKRGPNTEKAIEFMADSAGCSATEFKNQLKTTAMFWDPASALAFMENKEVQTKMEFVRQFCFDKGLLGEGSDSADIFGVSYPDGTVQGNKNKIKMRFDASFTKMAAEGKL